jgi:hypothetical protein
MTINEAPPDQADQAADQASAEPTPNRRERKKLETRQALEQAALRLFADQGYEQTTVEDIARRRTSRSERSSGTSRRSRTCCSATW